MSTPIEPVDLVIEHLTAHGLEVRDEFTPDVLAHPGVLIVQDDTGGTVPHIQQQVYSLDLTMIAYSNLGWRQAKSLLWEAINALDSDRVNGVATPSGGIHRLTVEAAPQRADLVNQPEGVGRCTTILSFIVRTVQRWGPTP